MSELRLKEINHVRRAAREARQKYPSTVAFARAVGCSQQHASAVLSGVEFPGALFALRLAAALGQPVETVLGRQPV